MEKNIETGAGGEKGSAAGGAKPSEPAAKGSKGMMEGIYDMIPLTARQIDAVIVLLAVAIVALLIIGALTGNPRNT